MNTDSREQDETGDDDVIVEDLFVEEYVVPLTLPDEQATIENPRGLKRQAQRMKSFVTRARKPTVLGGIVALGGLFLASVLFARGRRHRVSGLSRMLLRLGIAR